MADGYLNFDTKINESGFNSGISKLQGLAKVGVASIGAMMGAGIAAFGAVTKASLDSVASMEQNIGGVETLFKDAADTVIKNANRAYMTAGMSANEYMSNVTSFSASLLQSLAGDAKAAAEVADMAMTDMSDNANKMGTRMELIQNAYQGFAKQNYTMLDNLKLGYGGTKTEMERLLSDAQKLTGVKYDINNLSDVYNAIHAIQENLGITGTTAKEAATTIEGSMKSAKAAWDNFLTGTATAEEFADAFGVATENIIKNLGEIIPRLAETIPAVVSEIYHMFIEEFDGKGAQLFEAGSQIVADILTGIIGALPQLLTAGVNMLASFAQGIAQRLPELVPQALQMVVVLADAIISNIPVLVRAGADLLVGLVTGVIKSLPTLIQEGPRIINDFSNAIYSGIGTLLGTGLALIAQLAKGIIDNLPLIIENAGSIFTAILNIMSLSKMLSLGKSLIKNLGDGIKAIGPSIKSSLKSIGESGFNAIKNINWSQAGTAVITFISNGLRAAGGMILSTLRSAGTAALNAFRNISWASVGRAVITGIVSGITGAAGRLVTAAANAATNALNWVKKKLGIHSPSRVFRDQVGKMMALGIGEGFEKNIPIKAMNAGLKRAVNSLKEDVVFTTSARSGKTVGGIKNDPEFIHSGGIDWDEWERRQRRINRERDNRPIFLGTKRIDYPLPKGAVPQV